MEWKFPQIWIGNIRHCIHPEDLCSWYKAFKDLFCSMLVVKPWQESIPVPQREAQPLVTVSFVAAQPWTPKWRSLWPATSRSFSVSQQNPWSSKVIFFGLQVTHLPSPPRQLSHGESPRQWLCVIWLDRCQTCSISIPLMVKAGDSEWGIPQSFLTELDVCQAQNTEKIWAKAPSAFPLPRADFHSGVSKASFTRHKTPSAYRNAEGKDWWWCVERCMWHQTLRTKQWEQHDTSAFLVLNFQAVCMAVASCGIEDVLNQAMATRSNLSSSSLPQPSPIQQAAGEQQRTWWERAPLRQTHVTM